MLFGSEVTKRQASIATLVKRLGYSTRDLAEVFGLSQTRIQQEIRAFERATNIALYPARSLAGAACAAERPVNSSPPAPATYTPA